MHINSGKYPVNTSVNYKHNSIVGSKLSYFSIRQVTIHDPISQNPTPSDVTLQYISIQRRGFLRAPL